MNAMLRYYTLCPVARAVLLLLLGCVLIVLMLYVRHPPLARSAIGEFSIALSMYLLDNDVPFPQSLEALEFDDWASERLFYLSDGSHFLVVQVPPGFEPLAIDIEDLVAIRHKKGLSAFETHVRNLFPELSSTGRRFHSSLLMQDEKLHELEGYQADPHESDPPSLSPWKSIRL